MKNLIPILALFVVVSISHVLALPSQLFAECLDQKTDQTAPTAVSSDPEMEEFFRYFARSLRYPNELRATNIQTHMLVLIQVDDAGKSTVKEIIGENKAEFSEQVLTLIEKYPGNWDESFFGKTVALPFIFKMNKGKEPVPPSLENLSFDEMIRPITVTGYNTSR